MKKTLAAITLCATLIGSRECWGETKTIMTSNPNLEFFLQESDGGTTPSPAVIGAIDPIQQKTLWQASLGMTATAKIEASKNGDLLAVLVGDRREGTRFPSKEDSSNTVYVLAGQTGTTLGQFQPLEKFAAAPWANAIWQNLDMSFEPTGLRVSGRIFSYPDHPNPIHFDTTIPVKAPSKKTTEPQPEKERAMEW